MRYGQAKTGARDGPQPKIGTVECPEVYDEKFLFEYPLDLKLDVLDLGESDGEDPQEQQRKGGRREVRAKLRGDWVTTFRGEQGEVRRTGFSSLYIGKISQHVPQTLPNHNP